MRPMLAALATVLAGFGSPTASLAQPTSARRPEVQVFLATGGRSIDAVTERVRRASPALTRCDRAARVLSGEPLVTVRLEVDARGRVVSAAPIGSEPEAGGGRWRRCVAAVLSEVRFSRGARSSVDVVVAWRFEDPVDRPCMGRGPSPPGELPREEVQRVVREGLAAVRRCYERETEARPELAGRLVVLRFVIAADGSVIAADALDNGLGSATLTTCVRYQVRRWRFPSHAGHPVTVHYPFVLRRPHE